MAKCLLCDNDTNSDFWKLCKECQEKENLKEIAFQLFNEICDICGKKTITVFYSDQKKED